MGVFGRIRNNTFYTAFGLKLRVILFSCQYLTCQSDDTPQDHKEGGRRVDQNYPTENLLRQNRSFGNRRHQWIEIWWKLLLLGENLNLPGRGQEEGDNIQARRPEKERLVRKYSSRVETAPRSRNTYRLEKWNASSEKLGVDSHNHWPHLEKGILCHGGDYSVLASC